MEILEEINKISEMLKNPKLEVLKEHMWDKESFDEIISSPVFNAAFPERLLNSKFREMLKPFIFEKGSKTIYCRRYISEELEEDEENKENDENSSKKFGYRYMAITPGMLETDNVYFENLETSDARSVLDILYKPYFYELCSDEDLGIDCKWHKVVLSKNVGNEGAMGKKGRLAFAASLFQFKEVYIQRIEKADPDISYKLDDITIPADADGKINNVMDKFFKNVSESYLMVHRVGQANCVSGYNTMADGSNKCFAFDVGFPIDINLRFSTGGQIDKAATGIYDDAYVGNILAPDLIIISHWHQDHYKAAYTLKRSVFNGKSASEWIAPVCAQGKCNASLNRLIVFLAKKQKIFLVSEKYPGYSQTSGDYIMCRGKGKNLNESGLMLKMNNTLLTGDCSYENWQINQINAAKPNTVKNIIVPHHASGKSLKQIGTVPQKLQQAAAKSGRDKAVICVGYNKWGHPNKNVIDIYEDKNMLKFRKVLRTDDKNLNGNDFIIKDK